MPEHQLVRSVHPVVTVDGRHPRAISLTYTYDASSTGQGATTELVCQFDTPDDVERFTAAVELETTVPVRIDGGALQYAGVGVVTSRAHNVDAWRGRFIEVTLRLSMAAPQKPEDE